MKRQDLRNRAPSSKGFDSSKPLPKQRRALRLGTLLKVLGVLVLLALLWETLPQECKTTKTEVPRYCVD